MAFDGVISFQGKDHITAPQIGRLIAGVAGSVRGILQTQNQIKAAMQTANKVRIDTGDVLFDARMVTNEEPFELNVANGRAGYKRNDLVVLKYSKQVGGVEKFTCEVIQGTPTNQGNPTDPTYVKGDILSGSTTACMPLYRLPINGITVGEPVSLLPTINVLGDDKKQSDTDFDVIYLQPQGSYNNFWHIYRTGDSVTIKVRGWLANNISYDAVRCPFTLPENSRPPLVDHEKYNSATDGNESIVYNSGICPGHADVLTAISARPDGNIYLQDQGGKVSNAWRYGSLTFTVRH